MSFTVSELSPSNPVIKINDKDISISLLTLQKEVLLQERYGSLDEIFNYIKKDALELLNIIWILVINKSEFKNSIIEFKKEVLSGKDSIVDKSAKMYEALNLSIRLSMPLIKNKKRYKELQEIKGTENEGTPCYVGYFDTVAKRYGYTLDQFYQLTLRQLHMLLTVIGDKSYEELEVQAALQGKKLKPRIKFHDISEEEEADQEQQALDALKELQSRYEKNKSKDSK